jgi:MFS family permease
VIITALVFSAAACAVFLAAHGVGALYAARSLQGIAAGQGSFRMITALAEPNDRAGLVAAIYLVGYLAFSVPALIAGVATATFGLHSTALAYSASLAVLAAAAVGILLGRSGGKPSRLASAKHALMPPGPCTTPACPQAVNQPDG